MIKIQNLTHKYENRDEEAVKNINLHIKKGESLVLIGSSGSGKSTLLKCINRLIEPSSGKIHIDGKEILRCHIKEAEKIRGSISIIFQHFNLLERETVIYNVLNGRLCYNSTLRTIFGRFSKEDYEIAKEYIKKVGLEDYEHERVINLSGGEKQRVAIARALAQKPKIILADEPVSSLDPKLMREIMDLLIGICQEENITLVSCLHFLDFVKRYATRVVGIKDGRLIFDDKPQELNEKNIVDIYGKTKDWYMYGKLGF